MVQDKINLIAYGRRGGSSIDPILNSDTSVFPCAREICKPDYINSYKEILKKASVKSVESESYSFIIKEILKSSR